MTKGQHVKAIASLIGMVFAYAIGAAAAQAAEPAADYIIDPKQSEISPDGATTIEQYVRIDSDGDYHWQFWARRADTFVLLEPEQQYYSAGFRFTRDSEWVVRVQKTGSGAGTLYLYKLGRQGFEIATAKPLGDLAWDYFFRRPETRRIRKPDFHIYAGLVKGADENYRPMGVDWPDSRYLVILLSGELEPNRKHGQIRTVDGWLCRYDLKTGTFDVPPNFRKDNAKAIAPQ